VSESSRVTDEMFSAAARTLADLVTDYDLAMGRIYPDLDRIREVSHAIAVEVASIAFRRGLARTSEPSDLSAAVAAAMYQPVYDTWE